MTVGRRVVSRAWKEDASGSWNKQGDTDMPKNLMRLVLNPTTMEIIHLAIYEGLYPRQIAAKLQKSASLVTIKLQKLEEFGVLKGRFEKRKGVVVKKFDLVEEEITLRVDLTQGKIRFIEK